AAPRRHHRSALLLQTTHHVEVERCAGQSGWDVSGRELKVYSVGQVPRDGRHHDGELDGHRDVMDEVDEHGDVDDQLELAHRDGDPRHECAMRGTADGAKGEDAE